MKINQNTVLQGKKVTLVPYTSAHVPRYHEWMKSEELQRLTASEPLSLEQEYEMQCSWREDTDKCTFIILDAEKWTRQKATEEDCMVGDVNLFLTNREDPTVGEMEIMIAEPSYRGRGFGKEATLIMMSYGITHLGITTFEAKIGLENEISIGMFKNIHFKEV
ncbi:alpha/beta-tubulin-N-acetyltransferase 9 isoform X2 [Candoia aspera]